MAVDGSGSASGTVGAMYYEPAGVGQIFSSNVTGYSQSGVTGAFATATPAAYGGNMPVVAFRWA